MTTTDHTPRLVKLGRRFTLTISSRAISLTFSGSPGDRPFQLFAARSVSVGGSIGGLGFGVARGGVSVEHGDTDFSMLVVAPFGTFKPVEITPARVGGARIRGGRFIYRAALDLVRTQARQAVR